LPSLFASQSGAPAKISGDLRQNGDFIYEVVDSGIGMNEAEIATEMENSVKSERP
jgi:hypothetical protein